MKMKGQQELIASVIGTVIVCVAVLPFLFGFIQNATQTLPITNENVNTTTAPQAFTLKHFPVVASSYTVYNTSNTSQKLTETTQFNLTQATGSTTIYTNGSWKIDYSYTDSSYLTSSGDRTIMSSVFTFLIIGILLAAIGATGLYAWSRR